MLEIGNLLRQALAKLPLLPFSLVMEKWRWNVMAGRTAPDQYNQAWWQLTLRYQGRLISLFTTFFYFKYQSLPVNNKKISYFTLKLNNFDLKTPKIWPILTKTSLLGKQLLKLLWNCSEIRLNFWKLIFESLMKF